MHYALFLVHRILPESTNERIFLVLALADETETYFIKFLFYNSESIAQIQSCLHSMKL